MQCNNDNGLHFDKINFQFQKKKNNLEICSRQLSVYLPKYMQQASLTNSLYVCSCEAPFQSNRGGSIYKGKQQQQQKSLEMPTNDKQMWSWKSFGF